MLIEQTNIKKQCKITYYIIEIAQLRWIFLFLFIDLPSYFLQMTLRTQTTELFHLAPPPGSATPRVAVEVLGAPGAAATAMCPALMTQRGTMTAPGPTRSTSLIRAP